MPGTFGSVNTALSGLRYHQVVMDVASGNIANASTDGYARRRVVGEAVGAPVQPGLWSRYEGYGDGVRVADLTRMTDPLLDLRARREHGAQAYLDTRVEVLSRIEAGLGEPAGDGISAALAELTAAFHDLANSPDSEAARAQVLARAGGLADTFALQQRNVSSEEGDQRHALLSTVSEVNTLAADLAATNDSIAVAVNNGTDAGVLLDARDAIAMRLAELTGGTAVENSRGGLDVTVGGQSLVDGNRAGTFAVRTGVNADATADGQPVTFAVTPPGGTAQDVAGVGGEAGAVAELLTTTLPAHRDGLTALAQQVADAVNAVHRGGFDQSGTAGGDLFGVDAAGNLTVELDDPSRVAASGIGGGANKDGGNATALAAALAGPEASYQRMVATFGTEVSSVRRLALNQQTLTAQVDGAREQLSGVSLDEEMVTMLQAQRAYEASARVMTTLDSVLDTLINRTGLVR